MEGGFPGAHSFSPDTGLAVILQRNRFICQWERVWKNLFRVGVGVVKRKAHFHD